MKLIDAQAAADLAGVSREYYVRVTSKQPGHPLPATINGRGECKWREGDLLAWQRARVAARFKRAA